jgi:hypothetical protein
MTLLETLFLCAACAYAGYNYRHLKEDFTDEEL